MNRLTRLAARQVFYLLFVVLNVGEVNLVMAAIETDVKLRNHMLIKDQYVIKDAVVNQAYCEFTATDIQNIFPDRFSTDDERALSVMKDFLGLVCTVNRNDYWDQNQEAQESLRRMLDTLINTNSFALADGEKNLVAVMQGVVACNQAAIEQSQYNNPTQMQGLPRLKYCQARRRAINIFNNMDLGRVDFSYETEPANGGMLGLMKACYEGSNAPLGSAMALQCNEQSHLSNAEINTAIMQEYGAVSDIYLGGSGHITAMLSRKVKRVESMREQIERGIDALKQNHANLTSAYQQASNSIPDQDKAKLTQKMQEYQQALATASALIKTVDGWKRSLLFDNESQIDYMEILEQKEGVIADQLAAVDETSALLSTVKAQLGSRADPDTAKHHVLFNLCRIHYCEHRLPPLFPVRFTPLDDACTALSNIDNPLCADAGQNQMAQLCASAEVGFPAQYMPPATRAEGIACRSILP